MGEVAKIHTERLPELKEWVEGAQQYFDPNVKRFEEFVKFVFVSSVTKDESATLADMGKPDPEFNILEALISRLRAEFAKQQPSLTVRAEDGIPAGALTPELIEIMKLMEGHLRAIFFDGANDMLDYKVYSDLLAGGYSVVEMYTDYVNSRSCEQKIIVERVDPTMTGFDPLAKTSHKGDGRFCFKIYAMTEKHFEDTFGKDALKDIKFTRNVGGFSWSFKNEKEKIILVCDLYEKKTKPTTLYKLSNDYCLTKKEYEDFLEKWVAQKILEQPPAIVEQRKTIIESICRYRFCENKVLDYTETDYDMLPLVFVDGNSVEVKENGVYTQVTRPYVYHAKGIQRLKNFAGQSLANELENTIQHKFIVAIESLDPNYLEAYENVQKADTLMYRHFYNPNSPDVTLPPPREVQRTPIPPEITNTFKISDEMTQVILGNYDQGANSASSAPMSGVAFARSAIQSNNASVPYLIGWLKGLNRIGQMYVSLFPKIAKGQRSLPILRQNGERAYVDINKKGGRKLTYDPFMLQVKVEAGINFAMQKEIALQTITTMSSANKGFAEFFNQEGLPTLLDNIEIRGIDELKEKANVWMEGQKKQAAMAQQMQQQQMQIQAQEQAMKMAALQKELQAPAQAQVEMMAIQEQARVEDGNLAIKNRDSDTKFLEVLSKISNSQVENELKAAQVDAENARSAVDAAVQLGNHINETLERRATNGQAND